jgi:hypothetical protein
MYRYIHNSTLPRSPFVQDSVTIDAITPQKLIDSFELTSWKAEKVPNHTVNAKGIENSFYVSRKNLNGKTEFDGKILNTHVKKSWSLIQFDEGARWFDKFTQTGQLTISSALIVNDEHFGITCDLGLEADIGGGDTVDRYFMLALSHSPGMPRILGFTDTRAVCQNTLYQASMSSMNRADGFYNLEADGDKAMAEASRTLDILKRRFNEIDVPAYKHMREIKVQEDERDLLFRQLLGMPLTGRDVSDKLLEQYDIMQESYLKSPGMEMFGHKEHNGWRVLQGITWAAKEVSKSSLDTYLIQHRGNSWTKKTHKWLEVRFDRSIPTLGSKLELQPA